MTKLFSRFLRRHVGSRRRALKARLLAQKYVSSHCVPFETDFVLVFSCWKILYVPVYDSDHTHFLAIIMGQQLAYGTPKSIFSKGPLDVLLQQRRSLRNQSPLYRGPYSGFTLDILASCSLNYLSWTPLLRGSGQGDCFLQNAKLNRYLFQI